MSDATPEARGRLLQAWRGEIVAGAAYDLIARRMPDREAELLRRMAEAESGHRRRLEQRMRELAIVVPDRDSVRVPMWLRLQLRIAPVDRLLAAREAAEDEEVDDLYKRSTGDPATDGLLREIRKEERSHSLAVQDIRSGSGDDGSGAGDPLNGQAAGSPVIAMPGARARLDRILSYRSSTSSRASTSRPPTIWPRRWLAAPTRYCKCWPQRSSGPPRAVPGTPPRLPWQPVSPPAWARSSR